MNKFIGVEFDPSYNPYVKLDGYGPQCFDESWSFQGSRVAMVWFYSKLVGSVNGYKTYRPTLDTDEGHR